MLVGCNQIDSEYMSDEELRDLAGIVIEAIEADKNTRADGIDWKTGHKCIITLEDGTNHTAYCYNSTK